MRSRTRDTLSGLDKNQRNAIGLLSMGTFLEYFDLLLYIHMATFMNEIFFPQSDAKTASFLAAFAFCSSFVIRPFGAIIFGWIGDKVGRKVTVIITTIMMAASCCAIAVLPTYAQIGVTASVVVTICRIVQGLSSMGETTGAILYLTESIKPPAQYPAVASLKVGMALGAVVAIGIIHYLTAIGISWRFAFVFGCGVGIIGSMARHALRETPEFVDAKRKLINDQTSILGESSKYRKIDHISTKEEVDPWTTIAYFLTQCALPVGYYFAYMYCGTILKQKFGYSSEQLVQHNFLIAVAQLVGSIVTTYLSYHINPLILVRWRFYIFSIFTLLVPFLMDGATEPWQLALIQSFVVMFWLCTMPADTIYTKYFPIFKRFMHLGMGSALAKAIMYSVTSFGLVYLTNIFGNNGLVMTMGISSLAFFIGIRRFEKLEEEYKTKQSKQARIIDDIDEEDHQLAM